MTQAVQWAIFLFCAAICLRHVKRIQQDFPLIGLLAGFGIIHGLAPALTPSELLNPRFASSSDRLLAAIYACSCCLSIYAGWCLYQRHPRQSVPPAAGHSLAATSLPRLRTLFFTSAILGVASIGLDVAATGFDISLLTDTDRFATRFTRNSYLSFLSGCTIMFAFIPPYLGMRLGRRFAVMGILYACTFAIVEFAFISKGARAIPLGLLIAPCLGYVVSFPPRIRTLLLTGATGLATLVLSCVLYETRHAIFPDRTNSAPSTTSSLPVWQRLLSRDPLNYNETLVGAVTHFPRQHPYLDGASYWRIVTVAFPQSMFPNLKPPDTHKLFAIQVFGKTPNEFHTIPPSIPGDLYINFWGWPGLLGAVIQGWLFAWIVARSHQSLVWNLALIPQFGRLLMLGLRGEPYELFVISTCSLALSLLLVKQVKAVPSASEMAANPPEGLARRAA